MVEHALIRDAAECKGKETDSFTQQVYFNCQYGCAFSQAEVGITVKGIFKGLRREWHIWTVSCMYRMQTIHDQSASLNTACVLQRL